MFKKKKSIFLLILLSLCPFILTSCSEPKTYNTLQEINGNPVGCPDSSPSFYSYLTQCVPDSKILYYKNFADMEYSVANGITAAFICDEPTFKTMRWNEGKRIKRIDEAVATSTYGFLFRKDSASDELRGKLDNYLINNKTKLLEFANKWIPDGNDTSKAVCEPITNFPNPKGYITVYTIDINLPFAVNKNGKAQGYDCDVVIDFAKSIEYNLNLVPYSSSSILAALETGKCDFVGGGYNITEERKQKYNFSVPDYVGDVVLCVYDPSVPASSNPFIEGFYKTFIEEDRWKSFVYGILNTLLITILAVIIGTFAGYGLHILGLNNKVCRKIINGLTIFFTRTPIAVILMIFYYIIFGGSGLSAFMVSLITFMIAFSLTMNGLINNGTKAIDKGQFDSMYALGYTRTKGFNKVIFPQAIRNFATSYSDEVVSLIKNTSVVGFISVIDLTKATDLVRAASFQTFFPLITSAIIYFLLATILIIIIRAIDKRINPYNKNKKKENKGAKDVKNS